MTEKLKKRRIPSVAACRQAAGRSPSGALLAPPAKLEEMARIAQHLANLPEDARAAAALRAFPPSNLKEALYRHAKRDSIAEVCSKTGISPASLDLYLRAEGAGQELRAVMRNVIENEYSPNALRPVISNTLQARDYAPLVRSAQNKFANLPDR